MILRDVTLRDGLQDEATVPTEGKLALFEALVAAGVAEMELTSFVRADRVPAMADAEQLCQATAPVDGQALAGPRRWGLVLNLRGAQRALDAGLRHLQFVVSISERHHRENAGMEVAASLEVLSEIVALGRRSEDAVVEVTLATAFGCPFEGPVPPAAVMAAAEAALAAGVSGIGLADTIGTAVPTEVAALVRSVVSLAPGTPVGVHLHDTRGLAIANALAAIDAGAGRVDGSVGGLGGCPFAPGATGNLALEDLAHGLEGMGIATGIDLEAMVLAAHLACSLVGRPVGSHVGVAGPRFSATGAGQARRRQDKP